MTVAAFLVALIVALLALSIHLVMPLYVLMVFRIVAAELAAYLLVIELVVAAVALFSLRDSGRTAVIVVAVAGIILAAIPLGRIPEAVSASEAALDAIGAPPATEGAFSIVRLFGGLDAGQRRLEIRRTNDIPFRTIGATTLRLDRYDPPGTGPHPSIVVVHGGSWRNGDKGEGGIDPTITNRIFAARGYTVYDIQYRLVPDAIFPAQLEDVICALGFIRAQAAADGTDPERTVLLGRSAGAHLALLAAYRAGRDPLPDGCTTPVTVRGVMSLYAPTDLVRAYGVPADPDLIGGTGALGGFLGGSPASVPERYRLATPQNALDRPVPPTLLLHGEADQIVLPEHARSLAAALAAAGDDVALVVVPWSGHGFDAISWGPGGQIALAAMLRFLALVAPVG
ncbi:MAG: hypothetical protein NVS1B1_08420 [Candidatus Limnocylindrales bacterium]